MSVVLREPKDHIYVHEKMPFIFQSERLEELAKEVNTQVSENQMAQQQLKRINTDVPRPHSTTSGVRHIKSPSNLTTLQQAESAGPLDLEVLGVPAEKANGFQTVAM